MKDLKKYIFLFLGIILISLSYNLFCVPNNIVLGDILGLTIIFNKLFNMDTFMFVFIFNIILIVISYIFLGDQKTLSSTTYAILLPFFMILSSSIINLIDLSKVDLFIIAIIAGLANGFGYCLIYQQGFNTGGFDIITDLFKKHFKIHINSLILNILIVLISAYIFSIEIAVYGGIALIFSNITIRKYMFGINDSKTFYIFSDKIEAIKDYINEEEKQDVTVFDVITGLKQEKKKMIMSVLKTNDYYKIKTAIEIIDPNSFITISDSYETINPSLNIRGLKKKVKRL